MEQPRTTSLVSEQWFRIGTGVDPATGRRFVLIARNQDGRATTWRIEWTTNRNGRSDWRAVGHTTPHGKSVEYPRPRNLSDSPIDRALRDLCCV